MPGMRHLLVDCVEYHASHSLKQLYAMAPYVDVPRMVRDMRIQMALFSAGDADYFVADPLTLDNVQACVAGAQPLVDAAEPRLRQGCRQIHQFLLDSVAKFGTANAPPAQPSADARRTAPPPAQQQQQRPATATAASANPSWVSLVGAAAPLQPQPQQQQRSAAFAAPAPAAARPAAAPVDDSRPRLTVWCDVDMFYDHLQGLLGNTNMSEQDISTLDHYLRNDGPLPDVFALYVQEYRGMMAATAEKFIKRGGVFLLLGEYGDNFFKKLRLPWKCKTWFRSQSTVTPYGTQLLGPAFTGVRWSSKSSWITNVPAGQAIAMTTPGSTHESLTGWLPAEDMSQPLCNVAISIDTRPSAGWFVYAGDINLDQGTQDVVLQILTKRASGIGKRVGPQTANDRLTEAEDYDDDDDEEGFYGGMDPYAAYGMSMMRGGDPDQAMLNAILSSGMTPSEFFNGD